MASITGAGKGILNKLSQPLGKIPKGGAIGFALGAGIETIGALQQGKGFGESIAKGAVMGVVYNVVGAGAVTAWSLASAAPAIAGAAMNWDQKLSSQYRSRRDSGNMNFAFTDTEQAMTMRQSAVQAIQGSKMNARSALGGEARLMHRGVPTRWN